MTRVLCWTAAVACLMLTGCASPGNRTGAGETIVAAKPERSKLCREEAPIDSAIKRTRCTSQEQLEKEREAAKRSMDSNRDKANFSGR